MSQTPTTDNIFHRVLQGKWKQISYGRGVYLFDTEGQRYLDACAGFTLSALVTVFKKLSRPWLNRRAMFVSLIAVSSHNHRLTSPAY